MSNSGRGPGQQHIFTQMQPEPLPLVNERGASKKNCSPVAVWSFVRMRWYGSVDPVAYVSAAESKNTYLLGVCHDLSYRQVYRRYGRRFYTKEKKKKRESLRSVVPFCPFGGTGTCHLGIGRCGRYDRYRPGYGAAIVTEFTGL